jgi:hypothetical protein
MRIVLNFLPLALLFTAAFLMTSCEDDEPMNDDPMGDGTSLDDGLYLTLEGQDPVAAAIMTAEVVEDEGFASQDRSGFVAGYMWLEAGDYNVVSISDNEVAATIGGSAATITDDGSACDFNDYTLVTTETDGPAFTVGTSGFYKVSHDATTSELIFLPIESVAIIGSATPGDWSSDTPLTGAATADGATYTAEGITLKTGDWKVRFNCRWTMNRRIDPAGSLSDATNGYQAFTNFGGAADNLVPGGADISLEEGGEYTVTISWTTADGWVASLEKTGDGMTSTFNPDDFRMAVVGDATAGGWGDAASGQLDQNLVHKEANGVHTWYGVVTFGDSGQYKFRANDDWAFDLGGDLANLTQGGDNITPDAPGAYYVQLSTADEGTTWSATVEPGGWSVIGEGSPQGNWDGDMLLNADGFVDGITTYSLTGNFTTAAWKFRAGADWPLNLGGDLGALSVDGDDIVLGAGGEFTVRLSFDGESYSATVE